MTTARLHLADARELPLDDASVHLVVTSPPYPMIAMWDEVFAGLDPACGLERGAEAAFEAMHAVLDQVWQELHRVLVPGGLACVNLGDATRTIDKRFQLWPNRARATLGAGRAGFLSLPGISWRKPTNAPNKFMGSGMLPAGAYVTYEQEAILVLRKGDKRSFAAADKPRRRRSAFFWEERNVWFSDLWSGLTGVPQGLDRATRTRSAAFPLELPARLVAMYSCQEDTVLDPFAGTGTTLLAAGMQGRHAVGVDCDESLVEHVAASLVDAPRAGRAWHSARLRAHADFVAGRSSPPKHHNTPHDTPVVTSQERSLELLAPGAVVRNGLLDWRFATPAKTLWP